MVLTFYSKDGSIHNCNCLELLLSVHWLYCVSVVSTSLLHSVGQTTSTAGTTALQQSFSTHTTFWWTWRRVQGKQRRRYRERKHKQGCKVGALTRLQKHLHKPLLPSLFLTNARSLPKKQMNWGYRLQQITPSYSSVRPCFTHPFQTLVLSK